MVPNFLQCLLATVKNVTSISHSDGAPPDEGQSVPRPRGHPLRWRRLLAGLGVIHVLIVALSFAAPTFTGGQRGETPFSAYVDVNREGNLPTWWAVAQLAAAASSLLFVAVLARHQRVRGTAAWWILGGLVLLFCLDEGTGLHERLEGLILQFTDIPDSAFLWLVIGVPLALIVLVLAAVSARHLPEESTRLIVLGVVTLLFAAVGLEFVAGESVGLGAPPLAVDALSHLEEFLELVAGSLLLAAPLAAVRTRTAGKSTSFTLMDRSRR